MKQKQLKKVIYLIMLFVLSSCSNEVDSRIEEVTDLTQDLDYVLTRSDPWDEEEESALKWAENRVGTGRYSPDGPHEFAIIPNSDSMADDGFSHSACFSWSAGFIEEETNRDVSDQYYLQIQWSYTCYINEWSYINMPGSKYGLVKVISDGGLERIPAYAFPYTDTSHDVYLRMRTIHEDFIGSTPVPDVESQYKYDRSLFSDWSYPASIGDPYINYWGFGRPQPSIDDIVHGDIAVDESSFIVRVYLPQNTDKYNYSYVMYNHNSGYEQYLGGVTNNSNEGVAIGTHIGKGGGQIELIAKRTAKLTGDVVYETVFRDYSTGERDIDIYISEYAFGYD